MDMQISTDPSIGGERSLQAQFLIPMGISLGFGILFATAITLVLVPVNLSIAYDAKRRVLGWVRGDPRMVEG